MRYLKFIFLFAILLGGCEKEYYWEYEIVNKTGYEVLIEGYDRLNLSNDGQNGDIENTIETIYIKPNKSFSVLRARGFQADPVGIFDNMGIDSVNIIFDHKKTIVQYCDDVTILRVCDIERNIAGYENDYERVKTGRSSKENEYRFTYTITEEDYNNAVFIEE